MYRNHHLFFLHRHSPASSVVYLPTCPCQFFFSLFILLSHNIFSRLSFPSLFYLVIFSIFRFLWNSFLCWSMIFFSSLPPHPLPSSSHTCEVGHVVYVVQMCLFLVACGTIHWPFMMGCSPSLYSTGVIGDVLLGRLLAVGFLASWLLAWQFSKKRTFSLEILNRVENASGYERRLDVSTCITITSERYLYLCNPCRNIGS